MGKLTGTRTDCMTGKKRQVELEFEIVTTERGKVFKLHGGPTGFEGFCIRNQLQDFEEGLKEYGEKCCWVACMGDVGYTHPIYDRLEIPATEMIKALLAVMANS